MTRYFRPALFLFLQRYVHAQGANANDTYDNSDDGSDDSDTCTFISGQSCSVNGICKYCAMCLQSSCILSKTVSSNATRTQDSGVCNNTSFGTVDTYSWYDYCLSSGEDNSGDYCATSTECYQYRKSSSPTVSYAWQNLTCNPTSCMLVTDSGQPAPIPGQLPPSSNTNVTAGIPGKAGSTSTSGHNGHHGSHHDDKDFAFHSPAAIALTVTCSFVFVVCLIWLMRLWILSRFWPPCRPSRCRRVQSQRSSASTPSTAPPSFSSAPEMAQTRQSSHAVAPALFDRSNSRHSSTISSTSQQEPLPSYFSPDPPPPKYEHAIVTQIRGLLDDSGDLGTPPATETAGDHNGSMPPPMWLPVYFTPNQSSFSFGRLRRHPPSSAGPSATASSSSTNEWADPVRAFWHHHQQQLQNQNPLLWQSLVGAEMASSSHAGSSVAPTQPQSQPEQHEVELPRSSSNQGRQPTSESEAQPSNNDRAHS